MDIQLEEFQTVGSFRVIFGTRVFLSKYDCFIYSFFLSSDLYSDLYLTFIRFSFPFCSSSKFLLLEREKERHESGKEIRIMVIQYL